MIDWLFKRKKTKTPSPRPEGAQAVAAASPGARPAPAPAAPPAADWPARLAAAAGDDEALLALASGSAPIDVKLAAVGALASEEAIRRAERDLRKHDRRVHRLAKQRLAELLARRAARSQAAQLTARAQALLGEPLIAANRLVELDRAWHALDPRLLEDSQAGAFAALFEQLTALVRERADRALDAERLGAAAQAAAADLRSACERAAAGAIDRDALAAAVAQARAVLDGAPHGADATASCEALRVALASTDALSPRLAALEELLQAAPPSGPHGAADPAPEAASGDAASQGRADALRRWHALPPLADAALAQALAARFAQWQHAQRRSMPERAPAPVAAAAVPDDGVRLEKLSRSVEQSEAALEQGNLAAAGAPLAAIDSLAREGPMPAALRARIDRLHAEAARLRGWQHWGSARARDELVAQAEALAAADAGAPDADVARLTTRQRAALISEMRARWKELDRHGGASQRALWQRFDGALNAAHAPVAAQAQAQREARENNLQARTALLAALEAVALPGAAQDAGAPDDAGPEAAGAARAPAAAALGAALAEFHSAWRKLGPLEHAVARAERAPLQARMQAAVERVETPLGAARQIAQAQREALIASARALAGAAAPRDSLDQARALQSRWQDAARSLPLARAVENALWAEFRAAIDAVYGARQAEVAARDAAFKASLDEREALLARIEVIASEEAPDATPDAIRRTLAEVDAAWRQAGAAPRAQAGALDARWRDAREAAQARLSGAAQRRWRAQCDALAARLDARDGAPGDAGANAEAAAQTLPPRWESALARQHRATPADSLGDDDLLLHLEASLGIDSPPPWQAARRALKLQAMKSALEARSAGAPQPHTVDDLLVAALGRDALGAANRERLRAAIAALGDTRPPGGA
ncbi:MAG TPA: DUF349 domain-containing protein [Burkholderiaceae bacterium]|mgnify:CR=1 FL=1|nr:DUF349 domain-containing protein [Burkholderiaceae bacterium]